MGGNILGFVVAWTEVKGCAGRLEERWKIRIISSLRAELQLLVLQSEKSLWLGYLTGEMWFRRIWGLFGHVGCALMNIWANLRFLCCCNGAQEGRSCFLSWLQVGLALELIRCSYAAALCFFCYFWVLCCCNEVAHREVWQPVEYMVGLHRLWAAVSWLELVELYIKELQL